MKKYGFYLVILLMNFALFAQQSKEKCFSDIIHQRMMETNEKYKSRFENFNNIVNNIPKGQKAAGTIYRVPIVIHVMHRGETIGTATNISDLDIQNGVRLINQLYRKEVGSKGDGNGVDVELEFALAVRDPNGNCTDGIVRYNMSGNSTYMASGVYADASGITEASLKALSVWDQTKYYNIWLVSEIDNNGGGSGIQGYAYYSSSHGGALDGAIFLSQKFAIEGNTTATHELGHAMNLAHTFNGDGTGGTCPTNTSCSSQGDYVCDTPPHRRSVSDCVTGTNACTGGDQELHIHNYMDYSSDACQSEFTAGQKTRAQTALLSDRASFLESNGNLSLKPPVIAGVNFRSNSTGGCVGSVVNFYDESSCIPNTYQNGAWAGITFSWTFNNGVDAPITSTLQNPEITFTNPGIYNVTLAVTNSFGTSSTVKNNFITISNAPTTATCQPINSTDGVGAYGIGIYNVTLNTINNSTPVNDAIYIDYSCSKITNLEPSTLYNISVTGDNEGSIDDQWWRVYIDYNNDGDFVDAGENIISNNQVTGTLNASFTTPAAGTITMNTILRMRVITDWYGTGRTPAPCANPLDDGQAEDYGVLFTNIVSVPEIAFSSSTTNASETFTADGNNDCRPFKDYVITMNIGSAPTGDAIVNPIIDSSYANSLYDYVILNSPLTFTNGATASKSFTVRVFDDAVIENNENIYLSYSISGTTNAVKGGGSLNHTISIADNDKNPSGTVSTIWTEDWESGAGYTFPAGWTVVHNIANLNNNWYISTGCLGANINNKSMIILDNDATGPFCGYWNYSGAPIYFYKQVNAIGLSSITVGFNWKGIGDVGNDFGELIYATNPAGPWTSLATYSGQTTTQTASVSLPFSLNNSIFYIGWRFNYNTDATINNNPSFSIDDIVVKGSNRNDIETTTTPIKDNQYVGPNQTVYFYNPSDGDLMVKLENTSSHDYGCTTVELDRSGTGTSSFQSNTLAYNVTNKSFKIIPTTNNINGTYNITLYYNNSEIVGWETATSRTRNEMEVVKTKTTIPSVSPSTPKLSETFYSTSSRGAFGPDYFISGTFSNGFSGFSAGIDAAISLEFKNEEKFTEDAKQIDVFQVNVSPVPFEDYIKVNLKGYIGVLKYEIKNIIGQEVKRGELDVSNGNEFIIRTQDFENGTYLLMLETENEIIIKKIIK